MNTVEENPQFDNILTRYIESHKQLLEHYKKINSGEKLSELEDKVINKKDVSKVLLKKNFLNNNLQVYYQLCKIYEVSPNPQICIVLNHPEINLLELNGDFTKEGLLPLEHLFVDFSLRQIKTLKFNGCKIGNLGCHVVSRILKNNPYITSLCLKYNEIKAKGIRALGEALKTNRTLKKLKLKGNYIGKEGSFELAECLAENHSLEKLDVTNCNCGYRGIRELFKIQKKRESMHVKDLTVKNSDKSTDGILEKGMEKAYSIFIFGIDSNFVIEEILNSVTHGLAFFFFVLPSFYFLMKKSYYDYTSNLMTFSYVIYFLSLSLTYISSCLLHAFFLLKRTARLFNLFDHISISILIAGTYTPLCLNSFGHLKYSLIMVFLIWFLAIFTVFLSFKNIGGKTKLWKVELFLYVLMGCLIFFFLPYLINQNVFSGFAWFLIGIGGVSYLVGIIFYVLGRNIPIYHVVWHFFVFFGSLSHFYAIYYYDYPRDKSVIYPIIESVYNFFE